MAREHNWSDTYTFRASAIHRPASIDDVRRLVAGAPKVRAVGSRHSFNGIADSSGIMIDTGGIDPDFVIDRERSTVTLGGGTSYGTLATHLQSQGWALHNMGSLPHITVAGATATGTHGSGDGNANLSSAVAGLQIVDAAGDLMEVHRGDAGFDGMVVGLGAFGVVTRVTLDIQPSFQVRQDAFTGLPWDTVLERLDEVMAAGYSVSLMTPWSGDTVGRLWLKTRLAEGLPEAVSATHLGATHFVETVTGGESIGSLTEFGSAGAWSERLPHFRIGGHFGTNEQIQSEYMVPRPRAAEALTRLRGIAGRIDALLNLTEIRSMAGDTLWLSPSYGHDTLAIHFTWKRLPEQVGAITSEIEDLLIPLGGRPHWGKLIHAGAGRIAGLYPLLADFRALAEAHDSAGKFRNDFLRRHVFA